MGKPEGAVVGYCRKCKEPIGMQHSYTWCSECGEPFTTELLARLPQATHIAPVQTGLADRPAVTSATASAIRYEPNIIKQFAAALYDQATKLLVIHAAIGIAMGGGIGFMVYSQLGAVLGAVLGGPCGYWLGESKAFLLRLQAQSALCQVAIEANTRSTGAPK